MDAKLSKRVNLCKLHEDEWDGVDEDGIRKGVMLETKNLKEYQGHDVKHVYV